MIGCSCFHVGSIKPLVHFLQHQLTSPLLVSPAPGVMSSSSSSGSDLDWAEQKKMADSTSSSCPDSRTSSNNSSSSLRELTLSGRCLFVVMETAVSHVTHEPGDTGSAADWLIRSSWTSWCFLCTLPQKWAIFEIYLFIVCFSLVDLVSSFPQAVSWAQTQSSIVPNLLSWLSCVQQAA